MFSIGIAILCDDNDFQARFLTDLKTKRKYFHGYLYPFSTFNLYHETSCVNRT